MDKKHIKNTLSKLKKNNLITEYKFQEEKKIVIGLLLDKNQIINILKHNREIISKYNIEPQWYYIEQSRFGDLKVRLNYIKNLLIAYDRSNYLKIPKYKIWDELLNNLTLIQEKLPDDEYLTNNNYILEDNIITDTINYNLITKDELKHMDEYIKNNPYKCDKENIDMIFQLDFDDYSKDEQQKLIGLCNIMQNRYEQMKKYSFNESDNRNEIAKQIAKDLFITNKYSFIITQEKVGFNIISFIIAIYFDKIYILDKSIPVMFTNDNKLNISGIVPSVLSFENSGIEKEIIELILNRRDEEDTIPSNLIRKAISERSNKIRKKFTSDELKILESNVSDKKQYFEQDGGFRFELSKRPVSLMTEMCKAKKTITKKKSESKNLFIPVIRYSGLYYSSTESDKKYCGKFYYIESESSIYLNLGKCFVFGSKVDAYITLQVYQELQKKSESNIEDLFNWYIQKMVGDLLYKEKIEGILKIWKRQKTGIIFDFYNNILSNFYKFYDSEDDIIKINEMGTTAFYPTDESSILLKSEMPQGLHDFLDQPLCLLAKTLGIDTIILQHEIGEYRSVSEVLDTRENSYDYLVQYENDLESCWLPNLKYDTIWFLENGLVDENGCCVSIKRNKWGEIN